MARIVDLELVASFAAESGVVDGEFAVKNIVKITSEAHIENLGRMENLFEGVVVDWVVALEAVAGLIAAQNLHRQDFVDSDRACFGI